MSDDHRRPALPPDPPAGAERPFVAPSRPYGGMDVPVPPAPGVGSLPRQDAGDLWAAGSVEVLAGGGSSEPPRRGRRGVTALVAAGVAAVLVGGAGLAWAAFNGDTGDQPEKHLPATTGAFVKVDLAPSGEQKIDAVRFFAKFPFGKDLQGDAGADPKKYLYEQLTKDSPSAPSWSEVEDWLGDRVALAAVPDESGTPFPVAAVQVTDDAKAKATFEQHRTAREVARVADGWAVITDTQAHLDAVTAATAKGTLSSDATFRGDSEALGDPGVLAGWADMSRFRALSTLAPSTAALGLTGGDPWKFRAAFVARFTGGNAEVSMRTFGTHTTTTATGAGAAAGALPADTAVAVAVAGGSQSIKDNWTRWSQQLPYGQNALESAQEQTGLKLPGDLADLLGERFALAVAGPDDRGEPVIGVRGQSSAPGLAAALDRLLQATDRSTSPAGTSSRPAGSRRRR
jgi:hypothetical protein